jgi:azurin
MVDKIHKTKSAMAGLLLFTLGLTSAWAQPQSLPATESDFYSMSKLPIPEGVVLEVGGMVMLPNGSLALGTRRGEVWIIENPEGKNGRPYYRKFASGLHEILGMAYHDGDLIMAQRGELTRLKDTNKDGRADRYETVYSWPISGHYHEYSYGPKFLPDGSMIVSGNVAFGDSDWWAGQSRVPWRGWLMKVSLDGTMEPWAAGVRSPAGIGVVKDDLFYSENQGDWMGSGAISHVEKGDFFGHPASLRWADRPESPVKVRQEDIYSRVDSRESPEGGPYVKPENLPERGKTLAEIAKEVPGVKPPAVWLPHGILGISTSELITIPENNQFGPFGGQVLVGDQGQSKISRVFLEKVKGQYQGGAVLFRDGFQSGVLRMVWGHDGSLYVGQTNRGWGSTGPDDYGLQRLVYTGKVPFEIVAVKAQPDGFEVEFTQPVDKMAAEEVNGYDITGFTYKYHPVYGSPVIDDQNCAITGIKVSPDRKKVRLLVGGLREKYIHEIKLSGMKNAEGASLLHNTVYYTLNAFPDGPKIANYKIVQATAKNLAVSSTPPSGSHAHGPMMAKRTTEQPAEWGAGPDHTFVLGTEPGLHFDKKELVVKAGSKVKLTMTNTDDMPHNFLLVTKGSANSVGEAAINLGLKGNELGYVPDLPAVLNHTKLIEPGGADTIYFLAPSQPGEYTYVCTYPGHYFSMQGTLKVLP